MGCFMACFGLSNKRKRRNTLYKVLSSGHHHHQLHKHANYQVLDITENSIVPYSHFRGRDDELKEKNSVKSKKKKKVTFNLNVQVYELNPTAYQVLNNEEEESKNSTAEPKGISSSSAMRYPLNHRYYNCTDGYDEEDDEMAYEESDIDDYDDEDEFDDEYDWDEGDSDGSLGNDAGKVYDENSKQKGLEERTMNQKPLAPNDANKSGGGDRSIDMHSVLCPVENLTQWKAIKAKVASSRNRRKENVPSEPNTSMSLVSEATLNFSPCSLESNALQSKPLMPEMAVDASLSNWKGLYKHTTSLLVNTNFQRRVR